MVLVDKSLASTAFIGYIALAYTILTPAKNISKASYQVKTGLAAAERVFTLMEEENNIKDQLNEKSRKKSKLGEDENETIDPNDSLLDVHLYKFYYLEFIYKFIAIFE